MAAIIIMFSIGMLPIQLAWMIQDFGPPKVNSNGALEMLFIVGDLALCFHASLDPVLYGVFVKQFRREYLLYLHKALSCCCDVKPPVLSQESSSSHRLEELPSKSRLTTASIRET